MTTSTTRHPLARWAVPVLALVVTACGGGRGSSSPTSAPPVATSLAGAGGATSAPSPRTTVAPTTTTTAETFGTLKSPCGPGNAKGATDQGVTNADVTIGYGDDAGFSGAPGLDHELTDAMKAVIKWCNGQGGINGRQIKGIYYDAKVTDVNNVWLDACQKVFMMVGQGYALDSAQEDTRLGCKLATVPGYAASADFANAPLMYTAVPSPIDVASGEFYVAIKKAFPDKIAKTATMFANIPTTIDGTDRATQTMQHVGYTILPCSQQYNYLGETDWKSFVQKLKNCGAQMVYYSGAPYPNFENLLDAASQLDYHPIWLTEGNFYDPQLAQWNANGEADNVYVRTAFVPLEQASSNPAVKKYIDLVKASGGDIKQLGEQAMSGFLLWATAAKGCGSNLTRECVMDAVSKVMSWTAGGMHAASDPGKNLPPTCGMVLKLTGTAWVQWYPQQKGQFDCSVTDLVKMTGRVVDQAQLGPNRVSTKHLKSS